MVFLPLRVPPSYSHLPLAYLSGSAPSSTVKAGNCSGPAAADLLQGTHCPDFSTTTLKSILVYPKSTTFYPTTTQYVTKLNNCTAMHFG